jgi:hypothetical protein
VAWAFRIPGFSLDFAETFLCSRGLFVVLGFHWPFRWKDQMSWIIWRALLILVLVALCCLLLVFKEWGEQNHGCMTYFLAE